MADRPRHIAAVLEAYLAGLAPSPNGKGPAPKQLALSLHGRTELTSAADGSPDTYAYTFERFHRQTAHLTADERLAVFNALPACARAELWHTLKKPHRKAA